MGVILFVEITIGNAKSACRHRTVAGESPAIRKLRSSEMRRSPKATADPSAALGMTTAFAVGCAGVDARTTAGQEAGAQVRGTTAS